MSGNSPFFSVVIPTYQRASVIQECVQSALDQDFHDFEVIVIDDGSNDGSDAIVKAMEAANPKLRYVYQENAERSNARNHGIRLSKGEYICFLDSDDLYAVDHLSKFKKAIDHHNQPVAMLFCNSRYAGTEEVIVRPDFNPDQPLNFILNEAIGAEQGCVHHSILKEHQFDPKIRIGEDRELWFRISENYPVIHSDQRTIVIRDLGDRSIDTTNLWAYKENVEHINHIIRIDTAKRIDPTLRASIQNTAYYKLALCHFNLGNRFQALWQLLITFVRWPSHKYKYKVIFMLNILGLQKLFLPVHMRNEY